METANTAGGAKSRAAVPSKPVGAAGRPAAQQSSVPVAKPDDESTAAANSKSAEKPVTGSLVTVVHRNAFYRDGYRLLVRVALAEGAAIVLLIFAIIAIINSHTPHDRYFATTMDGRVIPLKAMNQPSVNDSELLSWAATAVTQVMTFGFHDYRDRLQTAGSKYFTPDGWASFSRAIDDADLIKSIVDLRQVVTAEVKGAPVIVRQGELNGVYVWRVEIPVDFNYQIGGSIRTNARKVTLTIVRRPSYQTPEGIGIQQWVDEPLQQAG